MLIESVRIHEGQIPLLAFHQNRMDRARRAHFAKSPVINLKEVVESLNIPDAGLHKLRIEYDDKLLKTEVTPYKIKEVNSLKVTKADPLSYRYKFADRTGIAKLFDRRGRADDIMMTKNGYIMDASYANLAFYDGQHWYTPSYPMLKGVRRESLLRSNTIRPAIIRDRDLPNFKVVRLINAMIEWGEGPEVPIASVYQ